jgi:hypothetical protein
MGLDVDEPGSGDRMIEADTQYGAKNIRARKRICYYNGFLKDLRRRLG